MMRPIHRNNARASVCIDPDEEGARGFDCLAVTGARLRRITFAL
jgi:hypothetical protein